MKYNILTIPPFDRQLKRLFKKYPSLLTDLATLAEKLAEEPVTGIPLGNNCFKIRLAIASKRRGKSGGARIITHVYVAQSAVYLLSIYDKSEQADLKDKELEDLLAYIDA